MSYVGFYRTSMVATLLLASACGGATPSGSVEVDANTVVAMQREGCLGFCPVYSVRVGGDGSVVFGGESYVRVIGEANGQAPLADVQELVNSMLDADFFSLQPLGTCGDDDSIAIIEDASSATTSLTLGRRTKTIRDDHGNSCAPRVLRSIEDLIDQVAETARWVECDTPDGTCFTMRPGPTDAEGG